MTFFNPRIPTAIESSKLAREAAQQMNIQFIERHVASVEELQAGMRALRPGEADAYFAVADPMVSNQSQLIIDTAITKRLPTMFIQQNSVVKGSLASYSVNFHEVGRLSAKYVQRLLTGLKPSEMPVEGVDKISLVINLKTAKQIGLVVPQRVLARADKVIR